MAVYQQPCRHCGHMVGRDARACPRCASLAPFGFQCPACLRPVERSDGLCSGCGRALTSICPFCGEPTFAAAGRCDICGETLLVKCENKRCGQRQYFENTRCAACGKPIKHAAKQINQRKGGR